MAKITFIGAGSFVFTRNLVRDILTFPLLADSTLTLMDINKERLGFAEQVVRRIVKAGGYPAKVVATTDYEQYLGDMDMIVTSTSGAGKKILDITKVKPGCVITDVARPISDVGAEPDGGSDHGQIADGMSGLVGFSNGGGKGLSLPSDIFAWNNGGKGDALDLEEGVRLADGNSSG